MSYRYFNRNIFLTSGFAAWSSGRVMRNLYVNSIFYFTVAIARGSPPPRQGSASPHRGIQVVDTAPELIAGPLGADNALSLRPRNVFGHQILSNFIFKIKNFFVNL